MSAPTTGKTVVRTPKAIEHALVPQGATPVARKPQKSMQINLYLCPCDSKNDVYLIWVTEKDDSCNQTLHTHT